MIHTKDLDFGLGAGLDTGAEAGDCGSAIIVRPLLEICPVLMLLWGGLRGRICQTQRTVPNGHQTACALHATRRTDCGKDRADTINILTQEDGIENLHVTPGNISEGVGLVQDRRN
jgi:hypothetical protein